MTGDDDSPRGYASPPCLAHEIDPTYFDPLAVDPAQARDVARWRKAERARLLAERAALSPRPYAIGVGLQAARVQTIFPQPHDIAMDAIVTEAGLRYP